MSACLNIREFIRAIEDQDELVRLAREVSLEYEVGAYCAAATGEGNAALLIERPAGSNFPIAANLYGTRKRIALALGGSEQTLIADNGERLRRPVEPLQIDGTADGRVVLQGDDIDLGRLPIPLWNVGDGGPFITAGVV